MSPKLYGKTQNKGRGKQNLLDLEASIADKQGRNNRGPAWVVVEPTAYSNNPKFNYYSNWQYMNFPKLYSVCINSKLQGSANSAGNQKRPFWGAPPFCILFHTCIYVDMLITEEFFFSNHKEGRCWFVHNPTTTPWFKVGFGCQIQRQFDLGEC